MELLNAIIDNLTKRLSQINLERAQDGLPALRKFEIQLLGQMALQLNPDFPKEIMLASTTDLDALVVGDWAARVALKESLSQQGLLYDELSTEIWIPPGAKFVTLFESALVQISALEPIAVLVSKAVKAREKNRFLVAQALKHFGNELSTQIEEHAGDLQFFIS